MSVDPATSDDTTITVVTAIRSTSPPYFSQRNPHDVALALGLDPYMTVAELKRRLAVAERVAFCRPCEGTGVFVAQDLKFTCDDCQGGAFIYTDGSIDCWWENIIESHTDDHELGPIPPEVTQ